MEFTSARSLLDTSQQAEDDLQQEPTPPSPLVQQSALRLTSQAGDASSTAAAGEAEVASEAAAETTGIAAPGIIILSPRQSPTPPPIFPSLTALFPPAAIPSQRRTNMTRIAALSNYLLRRQQATSAASPTTPASPPRELADWLAIESQSDAELQEEVGRLIQIERGYADEERRTEEEQVGYWRERAEEARRDMRRETELEMQEVEEEADEQALFVSSLRAGDSSRDRRRRRRRAGGEVDPDQPQPQALDDDALFRQFLTDEMDRRSSIFGGDLEAMEEASNVVDLTNEDEWGGFPPLPSRYTAESARPEDTWRLVETGAAAERADGGADGVGVTGRLWRVSFGRRCHLPTPTY